MSEIIDRIYLIPRELIIPLAVGIVAIHCLGLALSVRASKQRSRARARLRR